MKLRRIRGKRPPFTMGPTAFTDLPGDVLVRVTEYLSDEDLAAFRRVCRTNTRLRYQDVEHWHARRYRLDADQVKWPVLTALAMHALGARYSVLLHQPITWHPQTSYHVLSDDRPTVHGWRVDDPFRGPTGGAFVFALLWNPVAELASFDPRHFELTGTLACQRVAAPPRLRRGGPVWGNGRHFAVTYTRVCDDYTFDLAPVSLPGVRRGWSHTYGFTARPGTLPTVVRSAQMPYRVSATNGGFTVGLVPLYRFEPLTDEQVASYAARVPWHEDRPREVTKLYNVPSHLIGDKYLVQRIIRPAFDGHLEPLVHEVLAAMDLGQVYPCLIGREYVAYDPQTKMREGLLWHPVKFRLPTARDDRELGGGDGDAHEDSVVFTALEARAESHLASLNRDGIYGSGRGGDPIYVLGRWAPRTSVYL
jgi:hypothetical protein